MNTKMLKVINVIDFCQNRFGLSSTHSELAMTAAKKMRRTKSKEKTGHKVCRHLLDMLAEDRPTSTSSASLGKSLTFGKGAVLGNTDIKEGNFWFGGNIAKAENNGQISLSF